MRPQSQKKRLAIAAVALLALAGAAFAYRNPLLESYRTWQRGPIPEEVTRIDVIPAPEPGSTEPAPEPSTKEPVITPHPEPEPAEPEPTPPVATRPASYNLKVPFIPQAPTLAWDELEEDACEEASMLMIDAYLRNAAAGTPAQIRSELEAFVAYQTEHGDGYSITAARSAELMRDYLKIPSARVVAIDSIDDIKREIAAGNPVILPAAGKLLKNPYFQNGGPLYHMLVAKGYTKDTIITNDPGTRRGANYAYDQDVLWNAIHDWNGGDVENGAKVMIVTE